MSGGGRFCSGCEEILGEDFKKRKNIFFELHVCVQLFALLEVRVKRVLVLEYGQERDEGREVKDLEREELVSRLTEVACAKPNGAVQLAFLREQDAPYIDRLDLMALAELKVGERAVEMKFIDRVKLVELLLGAMRKEGGGSVAAQLLEAMNGLE